MYAGEWANILYPCFSVVSRMICRERAPVSPDIPLCKPRDFEWDEAAPGKGIKAIWFSDTHFGTPQSDGDGICQLVQIVRPPHAFVKGDIIDAEYLRKKAKEYFKELERRNFDKDYLKEAIKEFFPEDQIQALAWFYRLDAKFFGGNHEHPLTYAVVDGEEMSRGEMLREKLYGRKVYDQAYAGPGS